MVEIGDRKIGVGQPTYVIAEIGSNHGDSLERAYELIRAAAGAGADCAKFQLYRADELYPAKITPFALPDAWLPLLKDRCEAFGVDFLCSVFSGETLSAYLACGPTAIKIASPEATNVDLLEKASDAGLPLLVATGATDWDQVATVCVFAMGVCPLVLLHCVSSYPAPAGELNLRVLERMAEYCDVVGFSDHTYDTGCASMVAVALGASVIEKHLTLDRGAPYPDAPFALEPPLFRRMVERIRLTERMLGDGEKRPMPSEDPTDRRV